MTRRAAGRHHITETAPQHVRGELGRNLLGSTDKRLGHPGQPAPLLQWLSREQLIAGQRAVIAKAVRDSTDRDAPKGATAGGDKRRLRGIPMYAMGVGGTMTDTDPLAALIAKEEEQLRRSELADDDASR